MNAGTARFVYNHAFGLIKDLCNNCGFTIDRNLNAAYNLRDFARVLDKYTKYVSATRNLSLELISR